ncbi:MAG: hypothetical protein KGI57_00120 [Hyphomicrobiales bacterium]|nr:hypothetical protein [Hyphomicrobiales bacterium]
MIAAEGRDLGSLAGVPPLQDATGQYALVPTGDGGNVLVVRGSAGLRAASPTRVSSSLPTRASPSLRGASAPK